MLIQRVLEKMKSSANKFTWIEEKVRERENIEYFEFSCHANDSECKSYSRSALELCYSEIILYRNVDVCMCRLVMALADMRTKMKLEKINVTRNLCDVVE